MSPTRALISVACVAVLAAGCSAGSDAAGSGTTQAQPPTTSPASPSSVITSPTALTPQGSTLGFGQSATVSYASKKGGHAKLRLTVTGAQRAPRSDFDGFVLNTAYQRKAAYYYVRVHVANVSGADIGGATVPLWGVDATDRLLPVVTFAATFKPCASTPLPKRFDAGASLSTCLVYLSPDHGVLTAVSFRPDQAFNPITWTGPVGVAKPTVTKKPHKPSKSSSPSP